MILKPQISTPHTLQAACVQLRKPHTADGVDIDRLIKSCPPLDRNSTYVYLLLCTHFAQTCIVAHMDNELVGFISAYIHPQKNNTLFVWQVAVHEKARGLGVAARMLNELLDRPNLEHIQYVETTVDPDNTASRRLFEKLALAHKTEINEVDFLQPEHFLTPQVEPLLRIGPLAVLSS